MKQIESFSVWQTSKVNAITFAGMGFIFGALFTVLALLIPGRHSQHPMPPIGALVLVVIFPVAFAFEGLIATAVFCWVYNRVAKIVGGVEFVVSDR